MKTFNPIHLVTRKLGSVVGLGITLLFGFLLPQAANAVISGSAHDFDTAGFSTEICNVCHTPHNGNATDAPLWNHGVTTSSFTLYDSSVSSTLDAVTAQPVGITKMCLSCHDGSIAIDTFGGATGTNFVTGTALLGTDLSNDHPVAFIYNDALASTDGELHPPSTTAANVIGGAGTIEVDMLFGTAGSKTLECASCHDVHNTNTAASYLLRKDNAGSALCLTCHDK